MILVDGGSSGSLINKRAIPKKAVPTKSNKHHINTTASGLFDNSLTIGMHNIWLSEFRNERKVERWNCRIFDSTACPYNMILYQDFMQHIGIGNYILLTLYNWLIGQWRWNLHITMCWNINSSITSNTLKILWTPSAHQARRLVVWISSFNHSCCDLNIQDRCRF